MAKRKTSKAKASRHKRPPVDPVTGHYLLFDPVTGEPTQRGPVRQLTAKEQAKRKREENERRDASRLRRAARKAVREARLSRRPAKMRSREYALPKELMAWMRSVASLRQDHIDGSLVSRAIERAVHEGDAVQAKMLISSLVRELVDEAFTAGCTQGYIEGRVAELAVKREVSDTGNRRKRERKVSGEMDMDSRDAEIFAEVQSLAPELGKDKAEQRVAEKHDITTRRVRGVVLEQTVLPEYVMLVSMLGEVAASQRVLDKYGVDKHGKPDERKRAAIQKILPKLRLRKLPETP